jgi:hypothetical protein
MKWILTALAALAALAVLAWATGVVLVAIGPRM